MKKKIIQMTAVISAGIMLFTGCGNSGGSSDVTTTVQQEESTTTAQQEEATTTAPATEALTTTTTEATTKEEPATTTEEVTTEATTTVIEADSDDGVIRYPDINTQIEYYYDDNEAGSLTLYGHYPVIELLENQDVNFQKMKSRIADINEKIRSSFFINVKSLGKAIDEKLAGRAEDFEYSTYDVDSYIKRADSNVFSVEVVEKFDDNFGDESYTLYTGKNVDGKTGEYIYLDEILKEDKYADFAKEAVNSIVYQNYEIGDMLDNGLITWDQLTSAFENRLNDQGNIKDYQFTIDAKGINLYLEGHMIGIDYNNHIFARVEFSYCEDCINEKYLNAGDNYVMSLNEYVNEEDKRSYIYDFGDMGESKKLWIEYTPESYVDDEYTSASVEINYRGEIFKSDDLYWGMGINPYIFCIDGTQKLVIEVDDEYGYNTILFFDLSGDKLELVDKEDYSFVGEPTNSKNVNLSTNCDNISTYSAVSSFKATKEGFESNSDVLYWYSLSNIELTLKQDFEMYVVDEEGNDIETKTFKAGETFTIYRTNGNKDIVDVVSADGEICRMYVEEGYFEESVYGRKINGIILENVFEGCLFAG